MTDHRVHEQRWVPGRDLLVEVAVERGVAGLGQEIAGLGVHDDHRDRLGLVCDPRRVDLLLHLELQAGVDGRADILARRPGVEDLDTTGPGLVRLRLGHLGTAREDRVVGLLHSVLTLARGIYEAEQLGGQRRVRRASSLRIDADRLRLEG